MPPPRESPPHPSVLLSLGMQAGLDRRCAAGRSASGRDPGSRNSRRDVLLHKVFQTPSNSQGARPGSATSRPSGPSRSHVSRRILSELSSAWRLLRQPPNALACRVETLPALLQEAPIVSAWAASGPPYGHLRMQESRRPSCQRPQFMSSVGCLVRAEGGLHQR